MGSREAMMDSGLYLAFETGGTKLVAAIADSEGRIVKSATVRRRATHRAPRSFARVVAAADEILAAMARGRERLRAVGFGFGGTVTRSANRPHLCLHEDGWDEVDVVRELEARFGAPVFVENDCKLAALAEAHCGAGAGARSVFYVTLGTGVGGGYVQHGRILQCGDLGEAEIGHVVVDRNGPECCCGNRGCVEAMCSGPGLVKLCHLMAARNRAGWDASALSGGAAIDKLTSERIIRRWTGGDDFARQVVERSMAGLAMALAAAVNLMVPERIVIGGGLGTSSPRLLDLLSDLLRPLVVPYFRDSYRVAPSQLRVGAVTQGAAILARQRSALSQERPSGSAGLEARQAHQ